MSKHTPSPWYTEAESEKGVRKLYVECGSGVVAIVGPYGEPDEEDESNARLIAAAPDLLAACKALIELPEIHEALKSGRARTIEPLHMGRAAIAKAEVAE